MSDALLAGDARAPARAPEQDALLAGDAPAPSPASEQPPPPLWCGVIDCNALLSWRENTGNRDTYKKLSSLALAANVGAYLYLRRPDGFPDRFPDRFPALALIAALWFAKNMVAIWGQDTPTWLVPGSPAFFVLIYIVGIPSALWMLLGCPEGAADHQHPQRAGDAGIAGTASTAGTAGTAGDGVSGSVFGTVFGPVDSVFGTVLHFEYRDVIAVIMVVFGLAYSLAYELGRFRWKKQIQNKGRLHTVGLARFCVHPNYFGDLFTYNGWALAGATKCAFGLSLFQLSGFLWFVIPNADAYLAQRYPDEFPAYARKTATLIPFLHSRALNHAVAAVFFVVGSYASAFCDQRCEEY